VTPQKNLAVVSQLVEGHNGLNCALSQLANLAGTWDRRWISAMTNGPVQGGTNLPGVDFFH